MSDYNENDKVRGESLYCDDDAVFRITGAQLKQIRYLSKLQGGSAAVHFQIRDILREVVVAEAPAKPEPETPGKIIVGS